MDSHVVRQIETHIPTLRGYARHLVRDPDLANDMVQDCLERALSRLHLYRLDANLRGWLSTILLNVVRSHGREAQRRRWAPIDDHVDGLHSAPRQIDALRLRDLRRAFARLSGPRQEVIVLVAVEGMTYEEAARVLEVPVGTVRSRLSRARSQLKVLMEGTEPPHDVPRSGSQVLIATGAIVSVDNESRPPLSGRRRPLRRAPRGTPPGAAGPRPTGRDAGSGSSP